MMRQRIWQWGFFIVISAFAAVLISPPLRALYAEEGTKSTGSNIIPFPRPGFFEEDPNQPKGLIVNETGAFAGYTLIASTISTETYLIDMEGRVVNAWHSDYPPGQSAYLLENGNLLRTAHFEIGNSEFHGGGAGGRVQEFTWEGELVWDFEYSSDKYLSHHDIEKLPNGNILLIAWELKTQEEAIAAGRDPVQVSKQGLWPDCIVEVKPTGKTMGEVVWEWHVWDHLIQDLDPRRENYGVVEEHPELINLNPPDWKESLTDIQRSKLESLGYISKQQRGPKRGNPDWNHTNSIDYNAQLDQIVLSVLNFNEIWIIDHSTTTEQAAGHTGGKYGKGGDLLYRWGNPKSYGYGGYDDQILFAQHDAHWIEDGLKGAGNILIFNNGRGRIDGDYSSIEEIALPIKKDGTYKQKKSKAFGPTEALWTYIAEEKDDFFSTSVSGAQRLPNGNTLICSGSAGEIFEVTAKGEVVWKYINPVNLKGQMGMVRGRFRPPRSGNRGPNSAGTSHPGFGPPPKEFQERIRKMVPPAGVMGPMGRVPMDKGGVSGRVFRAYRYASDYPGLKNRKLTPGKTIEELHKQDTD
jgi:hypothetical protein